ncbi:unnamed protein product [Pleuronectes platessa]|uniref:Uncharacterized protein n=1 Tax=Pleuronectes platessa TaxID=8262 RepID=A0A9N7VYB6_PLEPL|nr:unnamed protein product [Pleuronectes platessa]
MAFMTPSNSPTSPHSHSSALHDIPGGGRDLQNHKACVDGSLCNKVHAVSVSQGSSKKARNISQQPHPPSRYQSSLRTHIHYSVLKLRWETPYFNSGRYSYLGRLSS